MFTRSLISSSQILADVKIMSPKELKLASISDYWLFSLLLLLKLLKQTTTGFTMFNIPSFFEMNSRILACVVLSVFLTACGSGGSGGSEENESASEASSESPNTVQDNDIEVVESVNPVVISTQPKSIIVKEGEQTLFSDAA